MCIHMYIYMYTCIHGVRALTPCFCQVFVGFWHGIPPPRSNPATRRGRLWQASGAQATRQTACFVGKKWNITFIYK